jgi:hypothetical protein
LGRSGGGSEKNGCGEEEPCGFDADGHSVSLAALGGRGADKLTSSGETLSVLCG